MGTDSFMHPSDWTTTVTRQERVSLETIRLMNEQNKLLTDIRDTLRAKEEPKRRGRPKKEEAQNVYEG